MCAHSKDVLALDDVKRLIEEDRRERKTLKKDKKGSLREGQKKVHQNPRVALLVSLKGVGALRCSTELSAPTKKSTSSGLQKTRKSGDRRSSSISKRVEKTQKAGDRSSCSNIERVKARRLATAVPLLSRQFFTKPRQPLASPGTRGLATQIVILGCQVHACFSA